MSTDRHLVRFYELLGTLEQKLGGKRTLGACNGRLSWPRRGVYFFFEPGETRTDSGNGPRVVRVGTHALTSTSKSRLWGRLSQHRGTNDGGGNHRGSIFRLLVGTALKAQGRADPFSSWGTGSSATDAAARYPITRTQLVASEHDLEAAVSHYIGSLPLLWLDVDDEPGIRSARGLIERNSIALLSSFRRPAVDQPSPVWLGRYCDRDRVRSSGLWNNNHVEEIYQAEFLDVLEQYVESGV